MNFPVGTVVRLVSNKNYGWNSFYSAIKRGERRHYKIIRKINGYQDIWGLDIKTKYSCFYINLITGKRIGSWEYSLYEDDLSPVLQGPVGLQRWL